MTTRALMGGLMPASLRGGAAPPSSPPGSNTTVLPAPQLTQVSSGSTNPWSALANGTRYYYVVTALNANGETVGSNEISAVATNSGLLIVEWNSVAGATAYKVYRGTTAGGENVLVATVTSSAFGGAFYDSGETSTSASPPGSNTAGIGAPSIANITGTGDGALGAATYYYKVTAISGSGETTASNELNVTLAGDASGCAARFTITPAAAGTGFKIYRGTSSGAEHTLIATIFTTGSGPIDFVDSGISTSGSPPGSNTTGISAPVQTNPSTSTGAGSLAAGTYYYVVTATNANGETVRSNEKSATLGGTGEVTVNWNTVTGATGYKIYRGVSSLAENVLVASVGSGTTSFVDQLPLQAADPVGFPVHIPWSSSDGNTFALATFLNLGTPVTVTDSTGLAFTQIGTYALSTASDGVAAVSLSLWRVPERADGIVVTFHQTMPALYAIFDSQGSGVAAGGGAYSGDAATHNPSLAAAGLTLIAFSGNPLPTYTPGNGFANVINDAIPCFVSPGPEFALYLDAGSGSNTPTFSATPDYWAAIGIA